MVAATIGLGLVLSSFAATAAEGQGALSGTVRVSRMPKPLAPLPVIKDGAVCGKQVPNESLQVSPERGIANVVVSTRPLRAGAVNSAPTPAREATLDQVGCRYIPHVQAVAVGTRLNLVNSDDVFHNVHANLLQGAGTATVFNLAMPFKGQKPPAVLKRPGMMKVRCDAGHTWMSAYVAVFDRPHFAVTDAQGNFRIDNLPPGEYSFELWHEPIEPAGAPIVRTQVVRIVGDRVTTVDPLIDP